LEGEVQTNLADFIKGTPDGERAQAILQACVHCGFCTATCPTYQILGDERDGPRGRIYLIKQVLEGAPATERTQVHLDRCLTCRNCETTCPSGVEYGHLLDIGRKVVEQQVTRPWRERVLRGLLCQILPRPRLVKSLLGVGYVMRPVLPKTLQQKLPVRHPAGLWPQGRHARKMLLLDGCVQGGMAPNINAATARVLDLVGVQAVLAPKAACCGALRLHLSQEAAALDDMRRNIDAWWPYVAPEEGGMADAPVEAIVMSASGCGVTVKEYGYLLAHDPHYAARAAKISTLTRDISEILPNFSEQLQRRWQAMENKARPDVAYHPPCTLQHGQQVRGQVEALLRSLGVTVHLPCDSHTCCGSAGTYSILQPELARQLRDKKLANLHATAASGIVSGNIGCISHLQSGTEIPVCHWIELLDRLLA
jgi:glycolate oxidase iron-sulfur subunit